MSMDKAISNITSDDYFKAVSGRLAALGFMIRHPESIGVFQPDLIAEKHWSTFIFRQARWIVGASLDRANAESVRTFSGAVLDYVNSLDPRAVWENGLNYVVPLVVSDDFDTDTRTWVTHSKPLLHYKVNVFPVLVALSDRALLCYENTMTFDGGTFMMQRRFVDKYLSCKG